MGLGVGQFARLKMTHLIAADRVEEDYLFRINEGTRFSGMILEALRGRPPVPYRPSLLQAWLDWLRGILLWSRHRRILAEGEKRARERACEVVASWK